MPDVISYIYANHSFPPDAREQVKLIADKIKTAFTEMINSITSTFGYSDNLFNMSVLGRRYEHIPNLPLESSFLDILAAVRKNRKLNELKLLREEETQDVITVIRRDLKDCDHKSFRSDDHLVFPMEFFREPFFTYNLPWSLNFGSFGSVFAHQLLHRLHLGVHPDPDTGYYNVKSCDLFVGNDGNKCSEKTQCFLSQYKNAIEPMFNKTSEQYLSTLQENIKKLISRMISDGYPSNLERSMPGYIGDNSGINLVLKAYKTLLQEECDNTETRLKGLEGYSSMQLLFFARAMASCGIMKGEKLPFWMVDNQHSPYEYRVNLPMQNSAAFAEAFHCEENTKMYRKESERCTFW
uniref:Putative peptidase family m13 includes neprilysin n=1 Tax=Amblyomma triste TaxID=251400 RepID=A0A023GJ01_AMBTT